MAKTMKQKNMACWMSCYIYTILLIFSSYGAEVQKGNYEYITNLFEAIVTAQPVKITEPEKPLTWLYGKWICTDRILRKNSLFSSSYIYLREITISPDEIDLKSLSEGNSMIFVAQCVFRNEERQYQKEVWMSLRDGEFIFENAVGDIFSFRKGPGDNPGYFTWEHKKCGDILFFFRNGGNEVESKHSTNGMEKSP